MIADGGEDTVADGRHSGKSERIAHSKDFITGLDCEDVAEGEGAEAAATDSENGQVSDGIHT